VLTPEAREFIETLVTTMAPEAFKTCAGRATRPLTRFREHTLTPSGDPSASVDDLELTHA
jgi:hypothetical protein